MTPIKILISTMPTWVTLEANRYNEVDLIASPPVLGSNDAKQFFLKLRESPQNGVQVIEQYHKRQLPEFCLERHINPDHTFCLYYGSESPIQSQSGAMDWWLGLSAFLANQLYAETYEVWPLAAGLSHGDAANYQLKMEALADPLGWKDDLLKSIFRGKGWLAERLPRISKNQDRVLNARSPCPRGCTQKHKILRNKPCSYSSCFRNCQKQHRSIPRINCPHRSVVEQLILLEHKRRSKERNIINTLKKNGKRCCGTMRDCPLR